MKLTIIGDIHGKMPEYLQIIKNKKYSVQLGDMGFKEEYSVLNHKVSSVLHKFVPGNHDDYDNLPQHSLGNFGFYNPENAQPLNTKVFFIRGEYSVDWSMRLEGVSWWRNEELSYKQMMKCLNVYFIHRPDIILSHGCPSEILPLVMTNSLKAVPSKTSQFLSRIFEVHKPKRWFFGHHHNSRTVEFNGTVFQCLNELESVDIEIE